MDSGLNLYPFYHSKISTGFQVLEFIRRQVHLIYDRIEENENRLLYKYNNNNNNLSL